MVLTRLLKGRTGNVYGVRAASHRKDRDAHFLAVHAQLFDCRRSVYVAGREQRSVSLRLEFPREFCSRCRLTGTLETRHQNDGDIPVLREFNLRGLGAHELNELFVDNFHDLLSGCQGLQHFCPDRSVFNALYKLLNYLEVDIGFEKCHAHFLERCLGIFFAEFSLAAQITKDALQFFCQTFKRHFIPPPSAL